jgi:hypothetical protein
MEQSIIKGPRGHAVVCRRCGRASRWFQSAHFAQNSATAHRTRHKMEDELGDLLHEGLGSTPRAQALRLQLRQFALWRLASAAEREAA